MKKVSLSILLILMTIGCLWAQDEEKKAAFQLSFFPPLSTQGMQASQYTNTVSFNILAGVSKNVTLFSLSSLGMYVVNDVDGFHLSGLGTYAGGDGNGVMFSGLLNSAKEYSGFQLTGLLNTTDALKGFQFAGLSNIVKGDVSGVQIAGLLNVAGDVNGFQFAGLINRAKNVTGIQFATFVNIAENNDYPIGLVNIIKNNGEMSIGVTYNEIGSTMVSFRSGGRILYGIIGVGYNHKLADQSFMTEGGLGGHIPISSRFRINNELKASFTAFTEEEETFHTSFTIMPAFKILPQWEIFAGPSINYMQTDNIENKDMFPDNNMWKKHTDNKLQQLYLGFSAGTHFLF